MESEKAPRPNWDEFFCALAMVYSSRATCSRCLIGCVFAKECRLASGGYNGSVSGMPHCDEVGHLIIDGHCVRTVHAEKNALSYRSIADIRGATAYVSVTPCIDCLNNLLQCGIARIVCVKEYPNAKGREYIQELCSKKNVPYDVKGEAFGAQTFQKIMIRLGGPGGIFEGKNPQFSITL